jgi:DNA-binding CsgD family transcriptional regulator
MRVGILLLSRKGRRGSGAGWSSESSGATDTARDAEILYWLAQGKTNAESNSTD